MKWCGRCNSEKPFTQFSRRSASKDGLNSWCKSCCREYRLENAEQIRERTQRYRDDNRERVREWDRAKSRRYVLARHGLTEDDFANMVEEQYGLCLICEHKPEQLVVDHCHESGAVRGLLCRKCNAGIGQLNDSAALLRRAAEYLETSEVAGTLTAVYPQGKD